MLLIISININHIIIIIVMIISDAAAVGFHNFNLRIFNLRVSNPNKLIVGVFVDTMSDFNVPGSRPNTNTMKFRKSTVRYVVCHAYTRAANGV